MGVASAGPTSSKLGRVDRRTKLVAHLNRHPPNTTSIALVRTIAGKTVAGAVGHDGHAGKVDAEVDAAAWSASGKRLLPGSEAGSGRDMRKLCPTLPIHSPPSRSIPRKNAHRFKPLAINLIDLYLIYFWARR